MLYSDALYACVLKVDKGEPSWVSCMKCDIPQEEGITRMVTEKLPCSTPERNIYQLTTYSLGQESPVVQGETEAFLVFQRPTLWTRGDRRRFIFHWIDVEVNAWRLWFSRTESRAAGPAKDHEEGSMEMVWRHRPMIPVKPMWKV